MRYAVVSNGETVTTYFGGSDDEINEQVREFYDDRDDYLAGNDALGQRTPDGEDYRDDVIAGENNVDDDNVVERGDVPVGQATPGPWSVEPTTDHGAAFRVMDEQEVTVALCYQQPHDTWDAEANAHLIASARVAS